MAPRRVGRSHLNMRLFFTVLLCALIAISAAERVNPLKVTPKCDGLEVHGKFHKNEVLAIGLNRPYQLSYHKRTHEIFFSNNVGNDTEDRFEIKRLLKNGTDLTIEEIENGFATAIDEENQIAYFGGSNGIYEMDLENGKIKKIIERHNIWDLFFKEHLYFITFPRQRLYKYAEVEHYVPKSKKHHKVKHEVEEVLQETWIHEEIYQFAIDGDGDIFITNETGLYMIKNETEHRIHIQGDKVFRAIEINHRGEAYFCGKHGVYVIKKHERVLQEVANVKNIFGLTFDSAGYLVYSNPHQIVKLLPSECKILEDKVEYVPLPIPT